MSRFGVGLVSGGNGIPGNDAFTKVLLHLNGANGSTSFPDVSGGGSVHSWSGASASISTAASKFGGASLVTAAGFITTADSADFTLGSLDWTIDFWLNCNGTSGAVGIAGQGQTIGAVALLRSAANKLSAIAGSTSLTGATSINDSAWRHVALVRASSSLLLFLNGVLDGSASIAGSIPDSANNWSVGRIGDDTTLAASSCFFDEFRLSVGVARWTSNFTPPSAQYI